jgi:8-oxo-dGTP diphosphatase
MALFLVRHAKAGPRIFGPDEITRPLTEDGQRQATQLAEKLVDVVVSRLLSSPYTRCQQTLQPLATTQNVIVETTVTLQEGSSFPAVLALLSDLPENSVLCSHGDVIPETIDALIRRGLTVTGKEFWNKGSVWELTRNENGDVVAGTSFLLTS